LLGMLVRLQLQPRQPILRAVSGMTEGYEDKAAAN
jgi:hypothetical protein